MDLQTLINPWTGGAIGENSKEHTKAREMQREEPDANQNGSCQNHQIWVEVNHEDEVPRTSGAIESTTPPLDEREVCMTQPKWLFSNAEQRAMGQGKLSLGAKEPTT